MAGPHRVLITGGAGYIGSILTRRMLESNYQVTVLDNFRYGQTSLLDCCEFDAFRIVRGDCRDEHVVRDLARAADIVIPLAAIVGAPACDEDPVAARSVNVDAIRLIGSVLSADQRVLFPVTNSGYGIGDRGNPCTEDSPLRPISLYGVTKVEAESMVLSRPNAISFRLATIFGVSPRMRMDLLVNDFVWRAVTDRTVVVFEGQFKRNYLHVEDVARVFMHGIDRFDQMKGRAYNVGLEDANLSKLELCREIKKIIPSFVFLEAPIGEDVDKRDYIVSNARIASAGFQPEWTLERGIRQLVNGYSVFRKTPHGNR